ncbi:MAG: SDR family oxidoreductase [Acidobacteriota bacterium]|nr:SDR family oxidoreductase [Acidobacteriota bacterium]
MTTALITGASSGIGREFARLLRADGHQVVLVARREAALLALAEELGGATVIALDLSQRDAVARLKAQVPNVDVLINNAGFGDVGPFAEADADRQLEMIDLNVRCVSELTKAYLPGMVQRRFGRVLNVASTAAFQPGPFMATYFASKAFVLSFSEALAEELRGTGVTVTALCPGVTESEFHAVAGLGETKVAHVKMPSAASVAAQGYEALLAGTTVVVTGTLNKLGTIGVRFLPRTVVRKLVKLVLKRSR